MSKKTYRFNKYVEEAKAEPFVLETDDGEIAIPPMTGEATLRIGEVSDKPREVLELICGDQYDAVYNLVADQPAEVLTALINDMVQHFNADTDQGKSLKPSA